MTEASYLPQASEYFVPGTEMTLKISIDLQINRTSRTSENQSSLRQIDSWF